MTNLVSGLLYYTALGKERILSDVHVRNLANNICLVLNAQIVEKQAGIKIGELPYVNAYGLEVRQLFQNLISNA